VKPAFSVLSIIGGIMTGLGVLVLLQQAGSVYPTRNVTILALLIGILWGIFLPTLTRTMAARKAAR
jgi:hypothetical protein